MIKTTAFLGLILTCSVAYGLPPEGLESFGLLGGQSETSIYAAGVYNNQNFLTDSEELQVYSSLKDGSGNLWTLGASVTVANQFGDRDAYFVKYDFVFLETQSLSLKLAHEDWKYIATGKDSIGLEFNGFVGNGQSGVYYSIGGYYRWLKQRYNDPWWAPLNLSTDDQEGFIVGVLGTKIGIGQESYMTLDLNLRDTFRYYHFDNVGTDLALNISMGQSFLLRIFTSARWAAFVTGVGTLSSFHGGIGFVSQ